MNNEAKGIDAAKMISLAEARARCADLSPAMRRALRLIVDQVKAGERRSLVVWQIEERTIAALERRGLVQRWHHRAWTSRNYRSGRVHYSHSYRVAWNVKAG